GTKGFGASQDFFVISRLKPTRLGRALQQNEFLDSRNIFAESVRQLDEFLAHKKNLHARIPQNERQLMRRQPNVQRQQNRACFQNSVIGLDQAVAIHAEKRHAIAGRNTQTLQASGKPAHAVGHLSVREAHISANYAELVRELLLGVSQKTNWSQWNFHDPINTAR